jgi:hypothetical protein
MSVLETRVDRLFGKYRPEPQSLRCMQNKQIAFKLPLNKK